MQPGLLDPLPDGRAKPTLLLRVWWPIRSAWFITGT